MSRSGYSDDFGDDDPLALGRYRAQVNSAIRGKRGQALLRELLAALDAMPEKRLVAGELEADGQFCALGVVGQARGLNLANIDTYDVESLGPKFNIAEQLAREIMWVNDESVAGWEWVRSGLPYPNEWKRIEVTNAAERRFQIVREWVAKHISAESTNTAAQAATDKKG
jgi:hypothetical protein